AARLTPPRQPRGDHLRSPGRRLGRAAGELDLPQGRSTLGKRGGLVWSHRIAVDQRRWITEQDFADIVSLCQFLPGPNIVGIAVCVLTKLRRSAGAIPAVDGFLLIPWTIGFTLGVLYLQHAHHPAFQNILGGVSAAAAGLLI